MEPKNTSKLPDGVGRKIIEALKKQSEPPAEVLAQRQQTMNEKPVAEPEPAPQYNVEEEMSQVIEEDDDFYKNSPPASDFDDFDFETPSAETIPSPLDDDSENLYEEYDKNFTEVSQNTGFEDNFEFEPEFETEFQQEPQAPVYEEVQEKYTEKRRAPARKQEVEYEKYIPKYNPEPPARKAPPPAPRAARSYEEEDYNYEPQRNKQPEPEEASVNILMRLISRLPAGVTRQTGAQIIRQTMEAMGISMTKVMAEAQQLQETLSQSIRDNINTIEEYRNNIRVLEKDVQTYRKQSEDLEDLIGLFIMSEKSHKKQG